MKIFLVKPHPPLEILTQNCPIPEGYRYNWEPVSLKVLAHGLMAGGDAGVELMLWHLMDDRDDRLLERALAEHRPEMVVFSEIDVLVNQVNRWALRVKELLPQSWTVVGGKQTSLLEKGDRFPFRGIDFAIRGDGTRALRSLVDHYREGQPPKHFPGMVRCDDEGRVANPVTYGQRISLGDIDIELLHSFTIQNHSQNDYVTRHQFFPSLHEQTKTAGILSATGCAFRCSFCQSPVEYGGQSNLVQKRPAKDIAKEISWFFQQTEANHFFFLEPNLDLRKLVDVYRALAEIGIESLSISGFVRAGDVVSAKRAGYLPYLAARGLRVLSIGLDIPPDSQNDIFGKSFSYSELRLCLNICKELGILVLGTFVGSPDLTVEEYQRQLAHLAELPLAVCEIRLAMALRNTRYFRENEAYLIRHPENDGTYFDRQNYRYQTLQLPGKIVPEQTYAATHDFYENYLLTRSHLRYVSEMIEQHPDTHSFFRRQYQGLIDRGNQELLNLFAATCQKGWGTYGK